MNKFSISQLQQFSGIKAHTIRIWEQRYNALSPNRSEGNTRYYDGYQLRRLLNIVSLMGSEYKVSELCLMPDEKLFNLIQTRMISGSGEDSSSEYFISQLIAAGMSYDSAGFEKIFSACITKIGITATYIKVMYPLLDRIGLMWASDIIPPAQEHFMSNVMRQKLFSEIDKLPQPGSFKDTWILFLPENEFHDIGLLLSYFLIRKAGKNVIYLGSSMPLHTLTASVKQINPSSLLLFFVNNDDDEEREKYCDTLSKNFGKLKIFIAVNEKRIGNIKKGKSIHWIHSADDLEKILKI
jgi:methanogenic corrinoid protein MtbC1